MDLLCTEEVVKLSDCDSYKNKNPKKPSKSNKLIVNRYNRIAHVNSANNDPTFLDDRCLENLLKIEDKYSSICTYFKTVQKDITPPMRKIVAEWMMEVCEEEKCQEEVFVLALNYMDRFLMTTPIRKNYLQILAAACLLLASKLREPSCTGLTAEMLVFYTDNSVHKQDLIHWELYVLGRLKWDLSSVTPLDFLELLLFRLPIINNKCLDLNTDKVRLHAQAFVSLSAKEHYFSVYTASTVASSSIAAALNGLNWQIRTGKNLCSLFNLLTDLTGINQDCLQDCMSKMESVFEENSRNLQPFIIIPESEEQNTKKETYNTHNEETSLTPILSPKSVENLIKNCKVDITVRGEEQRVNY